jgi:hypothetical protein
LPHAVREQRVDWCVAVRQAIEDARLAERLRTMKSAVDNKAPASFSHIGGNNSKKLTQDKGAASAQRCRGAASASNCATRQTLNASLTSFAAFAATSPTLNAR